MGHVEDDSLGLASPTATPWGQTCEQLANNVGAAVDEPVPGGGPQGRPMPAEHEGESPSATGIG